LRRLHFLSPAVLLLSQVVAAQDFNATVLPLTAVHAAVPGVQLAYGTGFCLNTPCTLVATTYHFATMAPLKRIAGKEVIRRHLATGPNDEGAMLNEMPAGGRMRFNLARDIAIFDLRHPIPNRRAGHLSLDDLQIGAEVDIYTYPKENPRSRKLELLHGQFVAVTPPGLLAIAYDVHENTIHPGASGGIVVDAKTQRIVGMLNGVGTNMGDIALAVPAQSLADFVSRVEPFAAQEILPPSQSGLSPLAPDLDPNPVQLNAQRRLQTRGSEPEEVQRLRASAQFLADSMRDFIAVQSFTWGSGDKPAAAEAAYEVRVVDGSQKFREYPDGTRLLRDVPFPPLNTAIISGGEWSELPQMVGTALRLRITFYGVHDLGGQLMRVFQYRASAEDEVCRWRSSLDFVLFSANKDVTVGCHGEVWTDENSNIVRISEHYELPGKWRDYQAVVTYGWLHRDGESTRLVPRTIASQAEYNRRVYWCRGVFADYRVFTSSVRMATGEF